MSITPTLHPDLSPGVCGIIWSLEDLCNDLSAANGLEAAALVRSLVGEDDPDNPIIRFTLLVADLLEETQLLEDAAEADANLTNPNH